SRPERRILEELPDCAYQGFAVARRDKQAVLAMAYDFTASRGIGSDDGAPASGGFDENAGHPFAVGRWQADHVALRNRAGDVLAPTQPLDVAGVAPVLERAYWNGGGVTIIGLAQQHKTSADS